MSWRGDAPKSTASGLDFDFYTAQWQKVANETRDELLEKKKTAAELQQLETTLQELPRHLTKEAMVPFGKVAFFPGELIHTNEITVLLGDNQYAEMPACRAQEIAARRRQGAEKEVAVLERALHNLAIRSDISQDIAKDEHMAQLFGEEMVFDKEPDLNQEGAAQHGRGDIDESDGDEEDQDDEADEDFDELKPQSMDSFLQGLLGVQQQREAAWVEDADVPRIPDNNKQQQQHNLDRQRQDTTLGGPISNELDTHGQRCTHDSNASHAPSRKTLQIRFRHSGARPCDTTPTATAERTPAASAATAATPTTPGDIQGPARRRRVTFSEDVQSRTYDVGEEPSRVSTQRQEEHAPPAATREQQAGAMKPCIREQQQQQPQQQQQQQQPLRRNVIPVGSVLERRQRPSGPGATSIPQSPTLLRPPPLSSGFPMTTQPTPETSSTSPQGRGGATSNDSSNGDSNILPSRSKPSLFLQRMRQRQP